MAQFLGFLFFLTMFIIGFWGIIFMGGLAVTWIALGPLESAGKIGGNLTPEQVRRKILPKQKGVEVIFTK